MHARLDHDRAFELIPWLANDTLPTAERAAVEEHVRHCLPCRIELKGQQSLRAAVLAQPTIHTSATRGFDRLLEQLDEAPEPRRGGPRHARSNATVPRDWRMAAGAALAASVVAAFVLFAWPKFVAERVAGDYTVLTDAAREAAAPGVQLDLVFAESLSSAERQRVLEEIGATVISGPSEIGRYRVRFERAQSDEALADVLATLNRDSRIRFAGRALGVEP